MFVLEFKQVDSRRGTTNRVPPRQRILLHGWAKIYSRIAEKFETYVRYEVTQLGVVRVALPTPPVPSVHWQVHFAYVFRILIW